MHHWDCPYSLQFDLELMPLDCLKFPRCRVGVGLEKAGSTTRFGFSPPSSRGFINPPIPSPLAPILSRFSSLPPRPPIIPSEPPPAGAIESPSMAAQLGLPPGYRFVPTDEELVRLHLLPCILDQPQPRNDIIVDDPLSAPPWALLEKHGRKQEAFFFAVGQTMNAKGNRQKRTCEGHGTWQGQGKRKREEEGKESKKRMRVSVCGSTKEIEWEKYGLNFQERGVKGSTGWVMHEYSITSPPEFARSPMRVYCIRHSGHGKNAKKHNRDAEDWGSDDEDDDEVDDATLATTWCAAEEDPALFIGAGNDQDLPPLVLDDATTWSAAEEDPTLFIDWSEKWG